MHRLEKIEDQIRELSAQELQALRAWFAKYDADLWDRQFENDAQQGKLDRLAEGALSDYIEGRSKTL
jgi:hypothetical protein